METRPGYFLSMLEQKTEGGHRPFCDFLLFFTMCSPSNCSSYRILKDGVSRCSSTQTTGPWFCRKSSWAGAHREENGESQNGRCPPRFFVLTCSESSQDVFPAGFEWFCTRLTFLQEISGTDTAILTKMSSRPNPCSLAARRPCTVVRGVLFRVSIHILVIRLKTRPVLDPLAK